MTRQTWARSEPHRAPAVFMKPLVDPAEWYPADFAGSSVWIYTLDEGEVAEILSAVDEVSARGLDIKDIRRDDFPLPGFSAALAEIRDELMDGRGFAMVRGLPIEGLSRAQVAAAFWGVGCHLGRQLSQNGQGHMLGHVKDIGGDYSRVRGYMTSAHMAFHCDRCDILALCCLHPAKSGGDHRVCSSVALYNEMLRRRPDLVEALGGYFYRSRSGELPPGETDPWIRQRVFNFHEGYFAARGVSAAIEKAQRIPGVPPLTERQREAIAMFRELAPELAIEIPFQRGDMFYLMNHVTLHSRGAFEDWPETERKRHLLRMWLTTDGMRPLPPEIAANTRGVMVDGTVPVALLDVE